MSMNKLHGYITGFNSCQGYPALQSNAKNERDWELEPLTGCPQRRMSIIFKKWQCPLSLFFHVDFRIAKISPLESKESLSHVGNNYFFSCG